jgi:hypothetical protein
MPVHFKRLLAISLVTGLSQVSPAQGASIAFVDVTVIAMNAATVSARQEGE